MIQYLTNFHLLLYFGAFLLGLTSALFLRAARNNERYTWRKMQETLQLTYVLEGLGRRFAPGEILDEDQLRKEIEEYEARIEAFMKD